MEETGGLSERQFGFRRGKSTTDAIREVEKTIKGQLGGRAMCLAVSTDIKNAFNTASWPVTIRALEQKGTPAYLVEIVKDYLKDRMLSFETPEGGEMIPVTRGVPQGSVLGPLLWNLMFDDVLRIDLPEGTQTVCYADDTIVTTVGTDAKTVQEKAKEALELVINRIESKRLRLAIQKTEAVLFTKKKRKQN